MENREKSLSPSSSAVWIKEEPAEDCCEEYDNGKDDDFEDIIQGVLDRENHESSNLSEEHLLNNDPEHIVVDAEPPFNEGATEVFKSQTLPYESWQLKRARVVLKKEIFDTDYETSFQTEDVEENQSKAQNKESFAAPTPPKQTKLEQHNNERHAVEAARHMLQLAADKLRRSSDDDIASFFKYVSTKVKSYSPQTKRGVQQAVFDILLKAERGLS